MYSCPYDMLLLFHAHIKCYVHTYMRCYLIIIVDAVFMHALLGTLMHALDAASMHLFKVIFIHAIIATSWTYHMLYDKSQGATSLHHRIPMPDSLHIIHGIFMHILDALFMHIEWYVKCTG